MKKEVVTILHNATTAKLHEPSKELRRLISDMLSYQIKDMGNTGSTWDGYSTFFVARNNTFPAGFARLIRSKLQTLGHVVLLKSKDMPEPLGPEFPKVDDFHDDSRYDYQMQTVNRLLKFGGMIAQIATGGGKSRIFKLCASRIQRPTLFITTRKTLMYQMAEAFERDMGVKVGFLGDGKWSPNKRGVNFAIVDTLATRIKDIDPEEEVQKELDRHYRKVEKKVEAEMRKAKLPYKPALIRSLPRSAREKINGKMESIRAKFPINSKKMSIEVEDRIRNHNARAKAIRDLLEGVDFLCLEEAHEVSGGEYFEIAQACKNARYRLALTATPFMKQDEQANMRLMAATGPIGIQVTEKQLIDTGILAKPYFVFRSSPQAKGVHRGTAYQTAYAKGIVENEGRNKIIVKEVKRAVNAGVSCLILIQRLDHADILYSLLKSSGIKVKLLSGKDDQTTRKATLDALERKTIDVIIGSTILDVGVDVPSIGMIVIAGAGKAEVGQRQRIGRGLRAKKKGANIAFILEFYDPGNNHLVRHSRERRRIIDETPGFKEGIVSEFPYDLLD